MTILYLNARDMQRLGIMDAASLPTIWDQVEKALISMNEGTSNLPLDAYLRSPVPEHFDRIIAKAGIVEETAGVKWIASAPANPSRGLPRATGLLILNDVVTGETRAILDAVPISNLRTAGVALVFLRSFRRNFRRAVIVGAGVHGHEHCRQLLHGRDIGLFPRLEETLVLDPIQESCRRLVEAFPEVTVLEDPEQAFADDTALLFCTNALTPHLGSELIEGRRGLTVVHTSLRDFLPEGIGAFDRCIADSVEHVARAKTSVDLAIQANTLSREACLSLPDLLVARRDSAPLSIRDDENVILNPMGLVTNDLFVGEMVYQKARQEGTGVDLET